MGIRNGQLGRLRISHPHLFRYLILRTSLGEQLLKARLALDNDETESNQYLEKHRIKHIIELYPCFFDRL